MSKFWFALIAFLSLTSCSSVAFDDTHYVLDSPNHNLRGHLPKDDLSIDQCDPEKKPDGTLKYKCVVYFFPEYQRVLSEIDRLQKELKACQGGQ